MATGIATPRLRLEPLRLPAARMLVAGYVPGVPPSVPDYPVESTHLLAGLVVQAATEAVPLHPFGPYQIVRQTDGRVIGDAGFDGPPDDDHSVVVSVEIAPSARGRGYGTEALCALLVWARARPEVRAVTADCDPTDAAARRVLERAGMRPVGVREAVLTFQA